MDLELKPCPFCGASGASLYYVTDKDMDLLVECGPCDAQGPFADTMVDAAILWNKRAGNTKEEN